MLIYPGFNSPFTRTFVLQTVFFKRFFWVEVSFPSPPSVTAMCGSHLKALVFLHAFEESVDCHLLSSFCDDSNLHISLLKFVLSTMGVSKESISKFLIGNRCHVKLRILQDWGCVILREIDFLLKIYWSIPCLHPSWKVHTWTMCAYYLFLTQANVRWRRTTICWENSIWREYIRPQEAFHKLTSRSK